MGVLSITPSLEFAAHGLLPGRGAVRDPNPVVQPDGGPRTSHYIWDIVTGGAPVFEDPEAERDEKVAFLPYCHLFASEAW